MKTKVVIADRRYSQWQRGQNIPGAWRVIWEYDGKDIPRDIPLTARARGHWKAHKDALGIANFRGKAMKNTLAPVDVESIISAAKRCQANIYINRMSEVIGYKIKGGQMTISKIRGWLYWTARLLGDAQAIQRGPSAMAKRAERRLTGKVTGRLLRKIFR